jgi:hypothetical protein
VRVVDKNERGSPTRLRPTRFGGGRRAKRSYRLLARRRLRPKPEPGGNGATGPRPPRMRAVRGAASMTDARVHDPAQGERAEWAPPMATGPVLPRPRGYGLTARLHGANRSQKPYQSAERTKLWTRGFQTPALRGSRHPHSEAGSTHPHSEGFQTPALRRRVPGGSRYRHSPHSEAVIFWVGVDLYIYFDGSKSLPSKGLHA